MTYNAADQLATMGQGSRITTFTHDEPGNMTLEAWYDPMSDPAFGTTTNSYDPENRLINWFYSADGTGTSVATMTYQGDGLRRTLRLNGALTTFIWNGDDYLGEY